VNLDRPLTLRELREVYAKPVRVTFSAQTLARVDASAATIAKIVDSAEVVYGVNTGFGLLAHTHIARHDLDELQRNLLCSATPAGSVLCCRIRSFGW
jgi:histidine ammonia-lyase